MQRPRKHYTQMLSFAGVVAIFLLNATAWASPTVVNGNFSQPGLVGWTVEFGTVTDGGGYALFQEDPISLSSTLSQAFTLPDLAWKLSFNIWMTSVPGGPEDPFAWPDAFTASLLDPATFDPLVANPGYTDFYYRDNTGYLETIAAVAGNTVTLNVSGLAGQDALLVFDLWASYDGMLTTVGIDNVAVSVIPAPGALLLGVMGAGMVGKLRRQKKL